MLVTTLRSYQTYLMANMLLPGLEVSIALDKKCNLSTRAMRWQGSEHPVQQVITLHIARCIHGLIDQLEAARHYPHPWRLMCLSKHLSLA